LLAERLAPLEFVLINEAPDGHFPNGVPNPLLPERRAGDGGSGARARGRLRHRLGRRLRPLLPVRRRRAFHRGYYLVGLLAEVMLGKHPGAKILHDPG
jgi:phosphomannomutase / phosphoglucomutase